VMATIIERLQVAQRDLMSEQLSGLLRNAADEIERLLSEIADARVETLVAEKNARLANAEVERLRDDAQVMDDMAAREIRAIAKQRNEARAEVERLTAALTTIERSGAPGATIVAKRDDDHACCWCSGMVTPCPVMTARKALEGE
jgi:predicted  nucleic acid-binding Zn-ribbon protein